ncbi:MAG: hypothetical protein KJN60_13730 [Boseongicola sp.]|nr:hypothetical protein [Boseongicola sp.]
MSPYIKVPRQVVRVTVTLCVGAAAFGLWLGARNLVSETEVIEAGAALFMAETGGAATECVGVPGTGLVWIAVRCGSGAEARVYEFSRQGTLIEPEGAPEA